MDIIFGYKMVVYLKLAVGNGTTRHEKSKRVCKTLNNNCAWVLIIKVKIFNKLSGHVPVRIRGRHGPSATEQGTWGHIY